MLQLRPHQQDVVDQLSEGFKNGHRCQILYAPTGFGKTEVAMSIMKKVAESYKKTAIVLDRVVLVQQTSLRLGKYDIPHGVLQSNHPKYLPNEPIQVCSAQTLEKRRLIPDMDLLIVDECHVQRKGTIDLIKNNPSLKVIGLTATPFTNGLGNTYSHVVGACPTSELIEKGWLTPLKVFIAKEIDMSGAKKVAGEWSSDIATERGMQITGDVVAEWYKKTFEIYGKAEKSVVFCSGVKHGKDLEKKFQEAGFNFVSISYKEDDEFKRKTIEEFAKPDSLIVGLIATDILTRGFDVADVKIGVSARPFSKSFGSHVQQMGRIMRSHPSKEFGVWLDHSGNYLRFRRDWDDLFEFGVKELKEGKESARSEPTEKVKRDSICPKCQGLWTSKTLTCDECGFTKQIMDRVITVDGVMEELDKPIKGKKIMASKDFYCQLLGYARMKGYKDGWAAYKFKAKYGDFPSREWIDAQTPSKEIMKWVKGEAIRYAKGQQKAYNNFERGLSRWGS